MSFLVLLDAIILRNSLAMILTLYVSLFEETAEKQFEFQRTQSLGFSHAFHTFLEKLGAGYFSVD